MLEYAGYKVTDPDALETPAMLVFDQQLSHNLRALCDMAGGGQNLMVHVKTHKSSAVVRRQLEAGVAGFKCATLKELEMVLECGATCAILAYPQTQACKVERLADLVSRFNEASVYACVSTREHVEQLAQVAVARSMALQVLLDLDVGMHRTGAAMGDKALELYRRITAQQGLEACGLHVYDGHEHITDPREREASTQGHIQDIQAFRAQLDQQGLATPMVVGGGSFSFGPYARTEGMLGSPGSSVYWDWGYGRLMPDMPFQWAALILTQVIDRYPEQHTLTTDLGYKAICGDPPLERRAHLVGCPQAELQLQNEEHGVFLWPGEMPSVGTYLLAVPGHVCPTTVRYPGSYLMDADGEVIDFYPHTARDRQ
jgi:D-serine deaminase-like pyridoxal phosphate-dependent protein